MRKLIGGAKNQRRLGAVGAALVAFCGIATLLWFVQGADERAQASIAGVDVYVVSGVTPVEAGTPIESIQLEKRSISAPAVVPNAVQDLGAAAGLVNTVPLLPGDQLRFDRLAPYTEELEEKVVLPSASPLLPPGYLEVTIPIPGDRALGGRLVPGESVAIVGSFSDAKDPRALDDLGNPLPVPIPVPDLVPSDPTMLAFIELENNKKISLPVEFQNVPAPDDPNAARSGTSTHVLLDRVLITAVQADDLDPLAEDEEASDDDDSGADEPVEVVNPYEQTSTPRGGYLISFALPASDIERLVFAAEWGSIWLARVPDGTPVQGTAVQRFDSIYNGTTFNPAPVTDVSVSEE